jgi:uncharacterized membrane protein
MLDVWIGSFYSMMNSFGFPDPVHVTLVHIPIGLVIGSFIFSWLSALTRWKKLSVTAYQCITLTFLFLFPVIVFGLMDWRNFYLGAWLTPIKIKMVLAVILLILSFAAFLLGFKGKESSKITLTLYSLCLIIVIGIGWFGARLIYGEQVLPSSKNYPIGEKIFKANCNICHANGGNIISPKNPLRNSDDLQNLDAFISLIRHPERPMPLFTASRISEKEAKELYDYIVNEINCPGGTDKGSQ